MVRLGRVWAPSLARQLAFLVKMGLTQVAQDRTDHYNKNGRQLRVNSRLTHGPGLDAESGDTKIDFRRSLGAIIMSP